MKRASLTKDWTRFGGLELEHIFWAVGYNSTPNSHFRDEEKRKKLTQKTKGKKKKNESSN